MRSAFGGLMGTFRVGDRVRYREFDSRGFPVRDYNYRPGLDPYGTVIAVDPDRVGTVDGHTQLLIRWTSVGYDPHGPIELIEWSVALEADSRLR